VELYGRVASLLEVGTGFHPELTGRENVFLNGTMLGMTRAEVASRFEEIVEFAGVGRFIDTPVKRYSSGMYVRLAFAVAAHLEPEILVVDEVLAVGDAEFQAKCLGKMGDVANAGRTVLFVSHNMAGVRLLTKTALLFRQGRLARSGETGVVVSEYLGESSTETQWTIRGEHRVGVSVDRRVEFISVGFVSARPLFGATDPIAFDARLRSNGYAGVVRISLTVFMTSGAPVGSGFSSTTVDIRANHTALVRVHVADHRLAPGSYRMAVSVGMGDHRSAFRDFDTVRNVLSFEVLAERSAHDTVSAWSQHWGSVRLESILVEAV
jgi:ABC-type Na+ transport system ATPase subunit NatA